MIRRTLNESGLVKIEYRGKYQNQEKQAARFVIKKATDKSEESIPQQYFVFQKTEPRKYKCKKRPKIKLGEK
ncbi:hypothetical protein FACS189426_02870 [Bacteroidia bacterium]|nr:hypothetical protein FACS189426_02870 [Bacteroidia bacterium]